MKKTFQCAAALLSLTVLSCHLSTAFAQGTAFTYQGRILDNGTNFTGIGQFQFALVTSTNISSQATATANAPSGGFITGYSVVQVGNGYVTAPTVTVTGGGGLNAAGIAHLTGASVTSITVGNPGNGAYTSAPTVTLSAPPADLNYTTYWSNDGTSSAGSEPAAAVSVAVTNGLFTVILGDTTQTNMTAIPAALFASQPGLQLRIWFSDGVNGFAVLSPLQTLTPAPYAVYANTASNVSGTISASQLPSNLFINTATGPTATINGGTNNVASGDTATVGGGSENSSIGSYTTIAGGINNTNSGSNSTIGGGNLNIVKGNNATIAGGYNNLASALNTTVGGGSGNTAGQSYAAVGGGENNQATGIGSFIGAGFQNTASAHWATLGGGDLNTAGGIESVIGGGGGNTAGSSDSTVGGGADNSATGAGSVVGGGGYDGTSTSGNIASGPASTVGGGLANQATNSYATVPGGRFNLAGGQYSFAAGQQAQTTNQGAFVWADSQNAAFTSTNNDSFNVRAQGGVRLVTSGTGLKVDGGVTATAFSGNGNGLTNLNATQLSGPVPSATLTSVPAGNLTGTLPAISGASLTALNASQLTSGTVPSARVSGTYSSAVTFNNTGNSFIGTMQVGGSGTTFTQVEAGQASLSTSSTTETNYLINYPQPFSSAPKVIATIAFGIQGVNDVYAINVSSNSTTAFRVNVMRLDTTGGWGQTLLLNWQAWQ